jgi:dihydroxyacetone kinase
MVQGGAPSAACGRRGTANEVLVAKLSEAAAGAATVPQVPQVPRVSN